MKFQSEIRYIQESMMILSNAAEGEYDFTRKRNADTLPDDCRADLERLSEIQREAVEGLSKEAIEIYFKPLDRGGECMASLMGCFNSKHALDELDEEEAFFDTLTLSKRLNAKSENPEASIDQQLADFIDYLKSCQIDDVLRWQVLSALAHPQEHKKKIFDLLRHVRDSLGRHEAELEDIFRRRRSEIAAYEEEKSLLTILTEESAYQIGEEMLPEEMTVLLFDPFALRGTINSQGQSWFSIGAFVPYAIAEKSRGKMTKKDVMAYGKIMADGNKLEILRLLSHKNYINRELADALKLSTATISYHMSVLTELELVSTTVSANKVIYSLNRKKMEEVMNRLEEYFEYLEEL